MGEIAGHLREGLNHHRRTAEQYLTTLRGERRDFRAPQVSAIVAEHVNA